MKNHTTLLGIAALAFATTFAKADQITVLGTASTYGVLAASTVTNSGPTVVSGDIGLYGGTSVTGFLPGTVVNGTQHIADTSAQQAMADARAGFTYLSGLSPTQNLTGTDLSGLILGAGVYSFDSSAGLSGDLTLDFAGISNTDIIFQIGSTLTTSAGSSITVVNQGRNNNVYYAVGSSATLGSNSVFAGDILAGASISLGTGAGNSCGSLVALSGAVTLLSNHVNNCSSTGSNVTPYSVADGSGPSPVPEPGSFMLLATGLAGGVRLMRRKQTAA